MTRVAQKNVIYKVFLDGVQVPWSTLNVTVGENNPGQAQIVLEPDPILRFLRPDTRVSIFFYDEEEEGDEDLDKLKLYWEGRVRAPNFQKTPHSQATTLMAEGDFALLGHSKLYAHGFGTLPQTPIVSGSGLVYTESYEAKQLLNFAIFGKALDPDTPNVGGGGGEYRDPTAPNYAERILRLMAYFSSYNALFRLQAIRTRLFGRIAAFYDESLGRLVPRALAAPFYDQMNSSISPDSTILDLLNLFNRLTFYRYSSVAGPVVPVEGKGTPILFPGVQADEHLYALPRPYLRNDYLFLPETYYAVPPSCNLIFPEFVGDFTLERDYMAEPTRAILSTTNIGAQLVAVAPDSLFRFEENPDPTQFWSLNRDGIKMEGNSESPYQSIAGEGRSYNLFGTVSDAEVEKGMVPFVDHPAFELFAAVSNLFDIRSEEGLQYLDSIITSKDKALAKIISGDSPRDQAFVYLMQALADYRYVLEKFRRSVSINLVGHRWLVPGFPFVYFSTITSYVGVVKSFSLSADSQGNETSSATLDYVRPLPSISEKAIRSIEAIGEETAKVEQQVSDLESQIDSFTGNARTLADNYVKGDPSAYPTFKQLFSRFFDANTKDRKMLSDAGISESDIREVQYVFQEDTVFRAPSGVEDSDIGTSPTFVPPVAQPASPEDRQDAVLSALTIMEKYANEFKKQVAQAAANLDPEAVPGSASRPDFGQSLKESIRRLSLTEEPPEEFMPPPVFANFDLLTVESAEEIYENLIGARRAFSEMYSDSEEGLASPKGSAARVLELRRTAYTKFVNLMQALDKIFPVLREDAFESQEIDGNSEWEVRKRDEESDESIRSWVESKFLRRERLLSLRDYLSNNLLKLRRRLSDDPTPTPFLQMEPIDTEIVPSEIGPLTWDNSILSKIVDEFQVESRIVGFRQPDGSVRRLRKFADNLIKDLRKSVKTPFLTTKGRQEIILDYASRHFGARAYGGK